MIEHIQINFSEDMGVDTRGAFWEETGMLRDIVQNHLMQILALIAMEPPKSMEATAIREAKTTVIKSIRAFDLKYIDQQLVRGQYSQGSVQGKIIPGYRQEHKLVPIQMLKPL